MRFALLATCLIVLSVNGCAEGESSDDPEDREQFRQELVYGVNKAADFIRQSEAGANVSRFALGWYVNNFLISVSAHDDDLFHHFHRNGQFVETYLKDTFQQHPAEEVAAIASLADQRREPLRRAAQFALEALRHIPNDKSPSGQQAIDRRDLVAALSAMKLQQERALAENADQSPSAR